MLTIAVTRNQEKNKAKREKETRSVPLSCIHTFLANKSIYLSVKDEQAKLINW